LAPSIFRIDFSVMALKIPLHIISGATNKKGAAGREHKSVLAPGFSPVAIRKGNPGLLRCGSQ